MEDTAAIFEAVLSERFAVEGEGEEAPLAPLLLFLLNIPLLDLRWFMMLAVGGLSELEFLRTCCWSGGEVPLL